MNIGEGRFHVEGRMTVYFEDRELVKAFWEDQVRYRRVMKATMVNAVMGLDFVQRHKTRLIDCARLLCPTRRTDVIRQHLGEKPY